MAWRTAEDEGALREWARCLKHPRADDNEHLYCDNSTENCRLRQRGRKTFGRPP